jgi:surface protein
MTNLKSITGLEYLNTSEVTNMEDMFTNCKLLTSLDLSNFNTSKVHYMSVMFNNCTNLRTIYVGDGWSTDAVGSSNDMFYNCTSLVGGKGTTYNESNPKDKTYAHIDGGTSNPGYFTDKNAGLRGDVDGDSSVNISDVTALIDYLLSGNASGINLSGADCNQDSSVNISDVTALVDHLLTGAW